MVDYSPREVAELLQQKEIQLVDVREYGEWEAGRIAGALHIPLAELGEQAQSLDPKRPLVFYCRSGSRSALAASAFAGAGYDAYNMSGGLLEWDAAGLPIDPVGGYVD